MDPLMVCIPDPWQRAQDRDGNCKACKYTHDQHGIMVGSVINKDQDHFEYQPREARGCASRVDSPKMLQNRCTTEPEPQRWPLITEQLRKHADRPE